MTATDDKKGEALKQQRFKMLEDIAAELAGDIVFPTYFDAVLRLRNVMRDADVPLERVVTAVRAEPLICARLIRLANSVVEGLASEIRDVATAIRRLGLNQVRNAALAVAMSQLSRSKELSPFSALSRRLWEHSLMAAAAAQVIARELSHAKVNPDEAQFAGLVHDLGAFYMLYRAAQYEELRVRPDTVRHLIAQWNESIGEALLFALQLPESIVEAVRFHDQPRPPQLDDPRSLGDVVYSANALAGAEFEWADDLRVDHVLGGQFHALAPQIETQYHALRAEFGG
ncbi:MAG: HDOD domain-containing protein [Rhodocyclaceae bacterium]